MFWINVLFGKKLSEEDHQKLQKNYQDFLAKRTPEQLMFLIKFLYKTKKLQKVKNWHVGYQKEQSSPYRLFFYLLWVKLKTDNKVKYLEAKLSGNKKIEVWGDGKQTRSFTYIDDCVKGIQDIMLSDITEPINLGSSEMVTINQLVDMVEEIAGVKLKREYNLSAPKGVNGRNSDNTLIKEYLGWEPDTKLKSGLKKTYRWIESQIAPQSKKAKKKAVKQEKVEEVQEEIKEPIFAVSTAH